MKKFFILVLLCSPACAMRRTGQTVRTSCLLTCSRIKSSGRVNYVTRTCRNLAQNVRTSSKQSTQRNAQMKIKLKKMCQQLHKSLSISNKLIGNYEKDFVRLMRTGSELTDEQLSTLMELLLRQRRSAEDTEIELLYDLNSARSLLEKCYRVLDMQNAHLGYTQEIIGEIERTTAQED